GHSRHLSTRDSPWRAEPGCTLTRPVEPKDSPGADGHRRHPGGRPGVAPGPHRALAYPPMELLLVLPVLLLSVVLHEYAHGWMALRQGDRTALEAGRLTMNPIAHIDPVGRIIVPLFLWLAPGSLLFGWARPVPVNPRNYRNYRRGDILVSVAGVAANLLLAALFTVMIIVLIHLGRVLPAGEEVFSLLRAMAQVGIWLNLILIFFNLIPIPPLDGSHVLYHLLPARLALAYRQLGRYGMVVLLLILSLAPEVIDFLLWPVSMLDGLAAALVRLST